MGPVMDSRAEGTSWGMGGNSPWIFPIYDLPDSGGREDPEGGR